MKLKITCSGCSNTFEKERKQYNQTIKRGYTAHFCSKSCQALTARNRIDLLCHVCSTPISRVPSHIESKNVFCSHSCATTHQNTHRTTGTRVSRLERFLAVKLQLLYPFIEFHFNRKNAIHSELDIYIPELRLAFEVNGIHHFKSIHGFDKLTQIQANDAKKLAACAKANIKLEVIDVSSILKFSEPAGQWVLDDICIILDRQLKSWLLE